MKRMPSLLLGLAFIFAGCSSSTFPEGVAEPRVEVYATAGQLMPSTNLPETEVVLVVRIYNTGSVPIELEKLRLRNTGATSLQLRSESRTLSKMIPPKDFIDVELRTFIRIVTRTPEPGPILVRGTAIFSVDGERFRHLFTSELG